MLISEEKFDLLKNFIECHDDFIIAGHKEPDGDCISSALGMSYVLKKLKKNYQLVSSGPFKRSETKKYIKYFSEDVLPPANSSIRTGLILVDCSEMHRLGDIKDQLLGYDTFIIDHHQTANANENSSIIVPNSPACAFLVQLIYEHFVGMPDKKAAETFLFGMCTDTGFFKFLDDSSKEFFIACSRLVESGANPRETFSRISNGKPFSTRKLLGTLLLRAEQKFGGKLIYTYETLEDTAKFGKNGRDSDSLYQLLLSVENTKAAVFLRQDTPTTITAGFRSQESIDVSAIASVFGGGGHRCAAGLCCDGTIEEILPKILKEFEKVF